jgi:DNA-binding response OmpR family regulator
VHSLKGISILIVDDESELREILAEEFLAMGASVKTASGGDEGFRIFEEFRPAVVLSDVRMSGGDGLTMLARIRELHPEAPPYVFLLSGYAEVKHVDTNGLRFEELIPKPFSLKELRARVVEVSRQISV